MSATKETKKLIKVDFNHIDKTALSNYTPAVLSFENTVFKITSWKSLLKIFYYLAYKSNEINSKYFDNLKNHYLYASDDGFATKSQRPNEGIYLFNGGYIFSSSPYSVRNAIKFSKSGYVSYYDTKQIYYQNSMISCSVIDNLFIIGQVIKGLHLTKPIIYLANSSIQQNILEQEKEKKVKQLTDKKLKKKIIEKNERYFIAHINGEVLSPEEKFFARINKEFDKKVLIGDIIISDEENTYLRNYMIRCLKSLSLSKLPRYPKVFAFGLVRYAMKYYGSKTFFPYFKKEYGISLTAQQQGILHDLFYIIMQAYNKIYDMNATTKIDNINMHCFVTDRCANQFFDYIFDYWRLDLNRNIENLYGEDGNKYLNRLIDEIEANNVTAVNNIMKHTSMAIKMNRKSGRLRIKRFLQIIDNCFWDQTDIPDTGNRFNKLIKEWMSLPDGKFQAEYRKVKNHSGKRGAKLLSHPLLVLNLSSGKFAIKLPQQILPHCGEDEYPIWTISNQHSSTKADPNLLYGRIGLYTNECEIALPDEYLFDDIRMVLASERRKYASFSFKKSNIRFFNKTGINIDYSKGFLPEGLLIAYSPSPDLPQPINGENYKIESVGQYYRCIYEVKAGDILKSSDEHAIPIGHILNEGLTENAIKGAYVNINGNNLQIYSSLPKIIFKTTPKQFDGTALSISGDDFTPQFIHIKDYPYHEFKLDDNLDDCYAYIIDLNDYITKDGIYRAELNIPANKSSKISEFAYLKGFKFKFNNTSYVFTDFGEVSFPASLSVIVDKDWITKNSEKILPFSFAQKSEYGKNVNDCALSIQYVINGKPTNITLEVPAFFWKFTKTDDWNYKLPSDVSLKNLPNYMYVKGPFDFRSKSTKLCLDDKSAINFDETDIYARKTSDSDYYIFPLSNAKSWLDYSVAKRTINIFLDGEKHPFLNVICRSIITGSHLYCDHDTQTLYGKFEIIGDSEYTIKIEHEGKIIGQDIPLTNGQFTLETDSLGGDYLITVYEIIDSDDGFDSDTIKLGEYSLCLFDISKMSGTIIAVKAFFDHERKFSPISLSPRYFITIDDLIEDPDINQIIGIWKADLTDPDTYKKCTFYKGTLSHYEDKVIKTDFTVLIVFFNKSDTSQFTILREYDGEYLELLYDYKTHTLIQSDEGLKRWQKLERIQLLQDDEYVCDAELLKTNN